MRLEAKWGGGTTEDELRQGGLLVLDRYGLHLSKLTHTIPNSPYHHTETLLVLPISMTKATNRFIKGQTLEII